jgi:hypothetical protein
MVLIIVIDESPTALVGTTVTEYLVAAATPRMVQVFPLVAVQLNELPAASVAVAVYDVIAAVSPAVNGSHVLVVTGVIHCTVMVPYTADRPPKLASALLTCGTDVAVVAAPGVVL